MHSPQTAELTAPQILALRIATKPLQLEAYLLLTIPNELTNAMSNGTIADPLSVLPKDGSLSPKFARCNTAKLYQRNGYTNRVWTFTNDLSNATIVDRPLPHQTAVLNSPLILGLYIASKALQITARPLLTAYWSLPTLSNGTIADFLYTDMFSQNRGPYHIPPPPQKNIRCPAVRSAILATACVFSS